VEHWRVGGCYTVDVLVDKHLIVRVVNGVVEHGGVQPDLDAVPEEWAVEDDRVSYLRRHGVSYTLLGSALRDVRTVRVPEEDADHNSRASLLAEEADHFDILGEEQAAVDEDPDVLLGVVVEMVPDITGHRAAMWIRSEDLGTDGRDPGKVRPEVVFMNADHVGESPSVARLWEPAAEPAMHGFRVDSQPLGDVHVSQASADKGASDRFADRACVGHPRGSFPVGACGDASTRRPKSSLASSCRLWWHGWEAGLMARSTAWGAYGEIANSLRDRVAALPPGSALPSEAALAAEYGVARNTVRRSLSELEREGLVVALPGRGRVVADATGAAVAAYRRIAEELRQRITSGDLAPGERVPSESELMATYRVSRGVARQGLAALQAAGLVRAVHGKGRFVDVPGRPPVAG
jgi:DNA-binding GntR family transcriptional regulator